MKQDRGVSLKRGQKRPFTIAELEALRLQTAAEPLQRAILGVGIDTMLRASDLLSLRVSAVRDDAGSIRETFTVGQRKDTNRSVAVSLTPKTREALAVHIATAGISGNAKLFPICHRTLQRMVQRWARAVGQDPAFYSAHSLRRTKASIIYQETKDIRRVQLLLGHKWITSTQVYVGGDQADAIALALKFDV
jgi:integrase